MDRRNGNYFFHSIASCQILLCFMWDNDLGLSVQWFGSLKMNDFLCSSYAGLVKILGIIWDDLKENFIYFLNNKGNEQKLYTALPFHYNNIVLFSWFKKIVLFYI